MLSAASTAAWSAALTALAAALNIVGNVFIGSNQREVDDRFAALRDRALSAGVPEARVTSLIEEYRAPFLETVVTEAEDDDLMERYLEGEEIAHDEIVTALNERRIVMAFEPVVEARSRDAAFDVCVTVMSVADNGDFLDLCRLAFNHGERQVHSVAFLRRGCKSKRVRR